VADLNRCYRDHPALHQIDGDPAGFSWIDCHDADASVLAYLRRGKDPMDNVVVACNFTPVPRHGYRLGVPADGFWQEILNSDAENYGGSGQGNLGGVTAQPIGCHGHQQSIDVTLPPLGMVVFARV
jgi:1,4-alpha-glucan branching enzyme